MKNKQFGVLNNGGGHNQSRLCKMHKRVIAVLSSLTMLFTTATFFPDNTFNLVREITANAEESENRFVLDVPNKDIDFGEEASKGNWKEDATLEKDGYHWDSSTQTLTLGNIQINCNDHTNSLHFPDNGLNTIVIAEGANPIVSKTITCANSSLKITGKGTLTIGSFFQYQLTTDDILTITGGAEVISNCIVWGTNGGIAISDGGKLNVSGSIDTAKIIMDDTAVLEMNADTAISFNPIPENYLADIKKYFPSGYKLAKPDGEYVNGYYITPEEHYIIPESASVVSNESGGYDLLYKDGTPVTGKVTLKANQQTNTGEKLVGHSISLAGNIGVNFYMELDESIVADETAHMQFTLTNGDTQTVNISDATESAVNDKTYYVFSCNIAAKEMADTITAQIISGDRKGTVYEYSVKEYADYITSHSNDYDKETVSLVDAMMNYGNSAKAYFSNEETTDISGVEADTLENFKKQTSEENLPEGIDYYGSSLLLESNTTVRHYFKVKEDMKDEHTFTGQKNGYYYTEISGIPAGQLGEAQEIKIGGWSISYSPMSYVYTVLDSDSADKNLVNLCKALYLYQQAAEAYQNNGGN